MNTVTQTVTLKSDRHYGSRPPAEPLGEVLRIIPAAVCSAIRMAFEGRSAARGAQPGWLQAASDIRFVDHSGTDETTLVFEAPQLGDAAKKIYEQHELWATRPEPTDSGFDLLADVVSDVAARNSDSERFDARLLRRVANFGHAMNGTFQEIVITGHRYTRSHPASVTPGVISTAREFSSSTPASQAARVMGRLDMIRGSTQSFGLKLRNGDEVRGVFTEGDIGQLAQLFQRDVLVLGKAVYRPSGRLLRIDASEILNATDEDQFFSKLPVPRMVKRDVREPFGFQQGKGGIGAIFGKWPGDESDDQIAAALEELS